MSNETLKVPTKFITSDMRSAGISEDTVFDTREAMVEVLGEEKVAEIEADASASEPASDTPSSTDGDGSEPASDSADKPASTDEVPASDTADTTAGE